MDVLPTPKRAAILRCVTEGRRPVHGPDGGHGQGRHDVDNARSWSLTARSAPCRSSGYSPPVCTGCKKTRVIGPPTPPSR